MSTANVHEQLNRERKALRYCDAIDSLFADVLEGLTPASRAEVLIAAMPEWQPQDWEMLRKQIAGERDVPSALTKLEIRRIYERRAVRRSPPVIVGPAIGKGDA